MVGSIFLEITIIVCLATVIAIIFRFLKQPAILAYILTGIIIGPFGQLQFANQDNLHTLAQLGITLLLFMLGLELRLKELRSIGLVALIVGTAQVVLTSLAGYALSLFLGFSQVSSLYISIALTFSSTIIIVKLLSDKKDLSSLYGKIAVGLLLLQDFFAVLILMLLSVFSLNTSSAILFSDIGMVFVKAFVLFALVIVLSKSLFPKLLFSIAKSQEVLFLFSLAWVFGLSAIVSSSLINFPIEIGGFLAGIALANSPENFQIVARVKALRDFFITIFFVVLGMEMSFSDLDKIFLPALIFSAFVLLAKPFIVTLIMGIMGYRKRTSFLTGLHLAQISEFSLIIIFLGGKVGHVSLETVSLITLVGIITFTFSTYMILNDNKLYKLLSRFLDVFEKRNTKEDRHDSSDLGELKDHVALIGAHRMGQSILNSLLEEKEKVVVVDFDPDIVKMLKERGVSTLFGDISDSDIQERVGLNKAKLVISTIPDLEDNLLLIQSLNFAKQNRAKIIVMAHETEDAKELYKAGADYVVLPHLVGGRHLAQLISNNHLDTIETLRLKDFEFLN